MLGTGSRRSTADVTVGKADPLSACFFISFGKAISADAVLLLPCGGFGSDCWAFSASDGGASVGCKNGKRSEAEKPEASLLSAAVGGEPGVESA